MSKIEDLINQGYTVMVSEHVRPDTVFAETDVDTESSLLVFNPVNYEYLVNPPLVAHANNMQRIYDRISDMAAEARERIDDMFYDAQHKHETRIFMFADATEAFENEDGSFTFFAQAAPYAPQTTELASEYLELYK